MYGAGILFDPVCAKLLHVRSLKGNVAGNPVWAPFERNGGLLCVVRMSCSGLEYTIIKRGLKLFLLSKINGTNIENVP